MDDSEKTSIAVTPPRMDTPQMRDWLESGCREKGWAELEWRDEVDQYGNPMGRLLGRRACAMCGKRADHHHSACGAENAL